MVLTTHPRLSAEIMKKKGYTSTPPLGLHGLLWENLYLYLYWLLKNAKGSSDYIASNDRKLTEKQMQRLVGRNGYG